MTCYFRRGVSLGDLPTIANSLVALAIDLAPDPVCFGLTGTLGAGKTATAQHLLQAVSVDPASVTSPTFTLWRTYATGDRRVHHLDAYRVADADQWWELGVDEALERPGDWTLIEWADRFAEFLPPETIWVEIRPSETTADRRDWSLWCEDERVGDKLAVHFASWERGPRD